MCSLFKRYSHHKHLFRIFPVIGYSSKVIVAIPAQRNLSHIILSQYYFFSISESITIFSPVRILLDSNKTSLFSAFLDYPEIPLVPHGVEFIALNNYPHDVPNSYRIPYSRIYSFSVPVTNIRVLVSCHSHPIVFIFLFFAHYFLFDVKE